MNNHPAATHLRKLVFEALEVLLVKEVPNAIPGLGFQVVLKCPPELRKQLRKYGSKQWRLLSDVGGTEVWMIPAWDLLKMADKIDDACKPIPQPTEPEDREK